MKFLPYQDAMLMKRLILIILVSFAFAIQMMADDYSMVIKDRDGKVHTIFVSDLDSVYFSRESFPEESNILYENVATQEPSQGNPAQREEESWLKGKKMLVIGDSQCAFPTDSWQQYAAEALGMTYRTHAKDGIGIIPMVDGDGSGKHPADYNPDNHDSNQILYELDTIDVRDVDVVVMMGFYNVRQLCTEENHGGNDTDVYPWYNSFKGRLNYAVEKVQKLLFDCKNWECKLILVSPHCYGKYPWYDKTGYDDGDYITDAVKHVAEYQKVKFIDLMHSGVVDSTSWNMYQNESNPYSRYYVPCDGVNDGTNKPFPSLEAAPTGAAYNGKFITIEGEEGCYFYRGGWYPSPYPCVWNADQLHLNKAGRKVVGEYIAKEMLKMRW